MGEPRSSDSPAGVVLLTSWRCSSDRPAISLERGVRSRIRLSGSHCSRLSPRSCRTPPGISGNTLGRCADVRRVVPAVTCNQSIPKEPAHPRSVSRGRHHPHAPQRRFPHLREIKRTRRNFPLDFRHLGYRLLCRTLGQHRLASLAQRSRCPFSHSRAVVFPGLVPNPRERSCSCRGPSLWSLAGSICHIDAQTRTVRVQAFRSERTIVTIQVGAARHKAFQVFFGRDRSLFLAFQNFRHRTGILAAATILGSEPIKAA